MRPLQAYNKTYREGLGITMCARYKRYKHVLLTERNFIALPLPIMESYPPTVRGAGSFFRCELQAPSKFVGYIRALSPRCQRIHGS